MRLSVKHGLNPTLTTCFVCGKENELLLVGSNTKQFREAGVPVSKTGEMPIRIGAINTEPCNECKEYMRRGIICISVKDGEEGKHNPYRTGGWVVIKDSTLEKIVKEEAIIMQIKAQRVTFIEDTIWDKLGFPREDISA